MRIKPTLIIVTFGICFTSCASVMNSSTTEVTVHTTGSAKVKHNGYTYNTENIKLTVPRSSQPLALNYSNDTVTKNVNVKPHSTFAYYFNIYANAGLGMLVDKNNPKRYNYPQHIYLDAAGNADRATNHWRKNKAGDVLIHYSLPYVNYYNVKPDGESAKNKAGFIGASIGLDIYHNSNQFFNLSIGSALTFFFPFPAPYHYVGKREQVSSVFFSVTHDHKIGRFYVGYGLAYALNSFNRSYGRADSSALLTQEPRSTTNNAFGSIFTTHYRVTPNFNIGLLYRPTFVSFNTPERFKYEHLLSIDLGWKINLMKHRR